ncbi:MAG: ATP-binding protein [Oscillospiraceae bacterium]
MKYPKKLAQRADTILAERRRIAEGNHLRTLARLQEKYPEIPETRKKLNGLYGKRSLVSFLGEANLEDIDTQIQKTQEQLEGLMAAAGINEADLQPPYTCLVCSDRGFVDGKICSCRQAVLNQLVYEQLCDVSPARECSFQNFNLGYYDQGIRPLMGRVVESCQRYVRDFGPNSKNLLFMGTTGLGKTHLSLAIAEGVAHKGHLVMYVSAPHLMDELERGKFQKDEAALEFREIIFGCDLLVIDDLGTEMVTSYTRSEVYDLVNTRLNTSHPTIINTNLTLQQIEGIYTSRVYSRIAGMFAVVEFKGRDIRLLKKYEGTV